MSPLALAGSLCFVVALALPAVDSGGFFSFRGRGWRVLALAMALMAAGCVALFKGTRDRIVLYFLPGLLNLLVVSVMVLDLLSVRGGGMILLGVCTLVIWASVALLMLLRMRRGLGPGAYLWSAACVLVALDAIARGCPW